MLISMVGPISCSDTAVDTPTEPGPFLLSASPALDETNVYPAPLWRGNGEEFAIELRFSLPMDAGKDLVVESDDHRHPVSESKWSDDRRQLSLFVRPDFSSSRPLADERQYALDLSSLVSASGALLEPDLGLRERRLVFSTGRYDPLLNHSCGHTFFGPFASVAAAGANDASAPDISATHTQYAVTKNALDEGYGGFLKARFPTHGPYRLYFDGEPRIALVENDRETALLPKRSAQACPGITHEIDLIPRADDDLYFRLGPDATSRDRVIVELVPQE